MNTDPAPAAPATPVLGIASLTLADLPYLPDFADSAHHDAGLPDLGPRAKGSHGSLDTPDTPTPSTPKRDTKRRRVARFIAPVPGSLDSVPRGPEGPEGPEGPRGPRGPRRRMDLRVTIPRNPWNGISHRDHGSRPKSGRWRIDDEPRDLADVGIVGIAPGLPVLPGIADPSDPSRAFAFAGLPAPSDPSVLPALQARPRVRAQKTLCNYPTQGHLFDFPTHEPSWPSLMAPHATDEFLGPQFLGPMGPMGPMGSAGSVGPLWKLGPWDQCEYMDEDNRKDNRNESTALTALVPSATMVSAAMTVRMATSPDYLLCNESTLLEPSFWV